MKLTNKTARRYAARLAAVGIRGWMSTLDYQVMYADPTVDSVHPECRQRFIYLCWHEYMLFGAYLRGRCGLSVLASRHRDGQLMADVAGNLGWGIIQGSTSRGGAKALLEMLRHDAGHLSLTPDGPRGPRRTVALGAIYVAARAGMPLVCCGYGYDRPWRARSWDRFALPRPYSRARAVSSGPIEIPTDLDRAGLESYRRRIEHLMHDLTEEAEQWAASGKRRAGQLGLFPQRPDRRLLQGDGQGLQTFRIRPRRAA